MAPFLGARLVDHGAEAAAARGHHGGLVRFQAVLRGGRAIACVPQVHALGRYQLAHGVDPRADRQALHKQCAASGSSRRTYGRPTTRRRADLVGAVRGARSHPLRPDRPEQVKRFERPGSDDPRRASEFLPTALMDLPAGADARGARGGGRRSAGLGVMTRPNQHGTRCLPALSRRPAQGARPRGTARHLAVRPRRRLPQRASPRIGCGSPSARGDAEGRPGAIGPCPEGSETVATVAAWFER